MKSAEIRQVNGNREVQASWNSEDNPLLEQVQASTEVHDVHVTILNPGSCFLN